MVDPPRLLLITERAELGANLREFLQADYRLEIGWCLPDDDPPDLILLDQASGQAATILAQTQRPRVLLIVTSSQPDPRADEFIRQPLAGWEVLARVGSLLAYGSLDGEKGRVLEASRTLLAQLRHLHVEYELVSAALAKERERGDLSFHQTLHDLRNPLNAIIGFARLVRRKAEEVLPEKQLANLDKIEAAARQLQAMLEELKEHERRSRHHSLSRLAPLDCAELLDGLERRFALEASQQGARLFSEVVAPPLCLRSDPDRLGQILEQLVSNALRFGGQGEVVVRCYRYPAQEPDEVRFEVVDQGPGLTDPEGVFEPFSKDQSSEGSGLGLSLARRHAQVLGGRLEAVNRSEGGALFRLSLSRSSLLERLELPPLGEGPDLLVIDDEVPTLEVLRGLLSVRGYTVHVTNTAEAGLETARQLFPSLIITDITMPGMTGLELISELAGDPSTASIPVVVFSGGEQPDNLAGVAAWLTKPFDLDEVQTVVGRLIGGEGNL
ncbi:MAG: hybrid sensor histidine kinase/response regulator [Candidatus Eremiobacteraeota bacterium]|nr:hybrid sensor histidine kinase/response regulator [Candidatus Eremiobacteraeota bacterium]